MAEKPELFVENPSHRIPRLYLSKDEYGRAGQRFIGVCVDAIVINRERRSFYLVKRVIKPAKTLWWLGGGIFPGEPESEGVRRLFREDTGLELPEHRFEYVAMVRCVWQDREQDPQEYGVDHLSYVHIVELTDAELAQVKLNPREYDVSFGLQEFNRGQLIGAQVYPPIIRFFDRVFQPATQ